MSRVYEELKSAKIYAILSADFRIRRQIFIAEAFMEMAKDELRHAVIMAEKESEIGYWRGVDVRVPLGIENIYGFIKGLIRDELSDYEYYTNIGLVNIAMDELKHYNMLKGIKVYLEKVIL